MTYYLGVDGGGTKTSFMLFDEQGVCVDHHTIGSIHFMNVGFEGIVAALRDVQLRYESLGFDIKDMHIAMGLGGYGPDAKIRDRIEASIWKIMPQAVLMNDAKFAMISALNKNDGVYLISGTGSIAFRTLGCETQRQGGYGYQIGDEGSAYWIGKKILERFSKEADQRCERTAIYDHMMKTFDLDSPHALIQVLNAAPEGQRFWTAQLSGSFASVQSDALKNIYTEAAQELAALANGFEVPRGTYIAFGGSVLLHNKAIREQVIAQLKPEYELVESEQPIEYAAYLLLHQ